MCELQVELLPQIVPGVTGFTGFYIPSVLAHSLFYVLRSIEAETSTQRSSWILR